MTKILNENFKDKALFTPQEIRDITGLSMPTVYRHIRAGNIKSVRIGPRLLFIPRSELERVMNTGTNG